VREILQKLALQKDVGQGRENNLRRARSGQIYKALKVANTRTAGDADFAPKIPSWAHE